MLIKVRYPEEHNIRLLAPMDVLWRFIVLPDGREDRTAPMDVILRRLGLTPNARAVILNRRGHWARLEHAAEFDRQVLGFLEKQDTE